MKAFITGIAGFIGANVADILVKRGWHVLGIDDLSGGRIDNVPSGCDFKRLSVSQPLDSLLQSFRPEVVYHLAAYAAEGLSHHIPIYNYENNLLATTNILSASYRAGIEHFVFTSSIAAYGHSKNGAEFNEDSHCNPCDPYGIAKLACELQIRSLHSYMGRPAFTIFRPHNVFGPKQNISDPYRNVVGIFMRCALLGEPMPIFGDGSQTRSFSYIDVVANCIADAPLVPQARNKVFNVGGDERMTVRELARQISAVMGVKEQLLFLPQRKEVQHAHCNHELTRRVFSSIYQKETGIVDGLSKMAHHIRGQEIPEATECPSQIEISDNLPPSWAARTTTTV